MRTLIILAVFLLVSSCKTSTNESNNLEKTNQQTQKNMRDTLPGQLVIGFKKNISQKDAEVFLRKENLKFSLTKNPNVGKLFYAKSGLMYIVHVPDEQVNQWEEKLKNKTEIEDVSSNYDPAVVRMD